MPATPQEFALILKHAPFAAVREDVMQTITHILLAASMPETPVRTGLLRRSETAQVEPGGLRGRVGTNVDYAPFVHKRVPFFEIAIDQSRAQVDRALQKAGDDYLAGLAKQT